MVSFLLDQFFYTTSWDSTYEAERNAAKATINWRFSTRDARSKLHRLYPFNSKID